MFYSNWHVNHLPRIKGTQIWIKDQKCIQNKTFLPGIWRHTYPLGLFSAKYVIRFTLRSTKSQIQWSWSSHVLDAAMNVKAGRKNIDEKTGQNEVLNKLSKGWLKPMFITSFFDASFTFYQLELILFIPIIIHALHRY